MASNATEVYVKLPTGRSTKYDMLPLQCIRALCQMIAKEEGLNSMHVRLKYQGKILERSKTIREYGVRVETILKAEFVVPKAIYFSLQLPNGDMDGIKCYDRDPVSSLFQCVADKTDVLCHRIQLKCGSKDLKQSLVSILDSAIEPGSLIVASLKEISFATETEKVQMEEVDKDAILSSFQTDGKRVDVVFSFDTTGSMYSYLTEVRSKLKSCCTRLLEDIPGIRIGLIAHGDYCDEGDSYVLRSADLTDSASTLQKFASDVPSTGGGDAPECYEWVLRKAQSLDWSEDSAKALVVIGDLYPHPPSYTDQNIKWRDELDILKGMGVKVYGVQAGCNHSASLFYAEISESSGGKHLNLKHFDLITDMFMAVCYREGNEELLEEFEQELQTAGNMTEEKKEIFTELNKSSKPRESTSTASAQRYVAESWWYLELDRGLHQYLYDVEKDIWNENRRNLRTSLSPGIRHTAGSMDRSTGRKLKSKCSLM